MNYDGAMPVRECVERLSKDIVGVNFYLRALTRYQYFELSVTIRIENSLSGRTFGSIFHLVDYERIKANVLCYIFEKEEKCGERDLGFAREQLCDDDELAKIPPELDQYEMLKAGMIHIMKGLSLSTLTLNVPVEAMPFGEKVECRYVDFGKRIRIQR